ncbi:hypothetical protein [Cupriavidus sp. H18C1]|uniref:hypothetical protein n=1 Tax=Cupriavidus sp. H18C1 TaxID=3241601 RepID=UPI003BB90802
MNTLISTRFDVVHTERPFGKHYIKDKGVETPRPGVSATDEREAACRGMLARLGMGSRWPVPCVNPAVAIYVVNPE